MCSGRTAASASSVFSEKRGKRDAAVGCAVGRKRPRPMSVGDDRQVIAARNPAHRENPCRGEELRVSHHAHRARALHRGVENDVGRRRVRIAVRSRMLRRSTALAARRRASCVRRPATPTGIGARRAPARRRAGSPSVSGSCSSASSSSPKSTSYAPPERNDRRESDAERRGEIEHRRAHGARLRDQREPSAAAR